MYRYSFNDYKWDRVSWIMNKTLIDWARNPDGTLGYTWNPITGCLNGCEYCYARRLANGRLRIRYIENMNIATPIPHGQFPDGLAYGDPFYPRFWEDRLDEIYERWQKLNRRTLNPIGVFVCDMSDLFGIGIPVEWTEQVMAVINACPQHRFYLLTKQPQNLIKFSPFPENCWVGVTATDGDMLRKALYHLTCVEAKVKYISFEPLLNTAMDYAGCYTDYPSRYLFNEVQWVIIGSQTKPYKPPEIERVKEIVEACDKARIPVFLKDNLKPLLCTNVSGRDVIESHNLWAFKYFKLRQEMPDV